MSVDVYYTKKYDGLTYNCAHFACDVWFDVTGQDVSPYLKGLDTSRPQLNTAAGLLKELKQSLTPVDPSIVIFQYHGEPPHAGVYLRGRVLHITKSRGVRFDQLREVSATAKKVRFYTC